MLGVRQKGADSEQLLRKVEEVPLAKHLLHCCCYFCATIRSLPVLYHWIVVLHSERRADGAGSVLPCTRWGVAC